ncbi:unnamed protein product [Durusdinium trenchii]|uniref:Uncharacterized protein n=1 Tax=Durusdinium trenchii TaxID=1381693 RepID=A0ABP0N4I6_9DINO
MAPAVFALGGAAFDEGLVSQRMTMRAVPYVFQAYAVDAPQAQVFQGLIMLPWAVKPILGLGSDLVPVMGFRKGPYMITATLLSIGAFTCIIGSTTSLSATVMCIMLIVLQFRTCDLLSEAQYATKIQEVPNAGPDLLSCLAERV